MSCNGVNTDDSQPNGNSSIASVRIIFIRNIFKKLVKKSAKVNRLCK